VFMKLLICPGRSEGARKRYTWASKTTAVVEPSKVMHSRKLQCASPNLMTDALE
jgi:hypothetical protein